MNSVTLLGLFFFHVGALSASIHLPSLCDSAIFPICTCYNNETSIVCDLEPKLNNSIGDPASESKWTISGDNVPPTAQKLIIVGGKTKHTTIVLDKAQVSPLKLKHLSFYGLGEVNVKSDLHQVECLYLLLNDVQKFAEGVLSPAIDITKVYDSDDSYPGFGTNEEATKIWLNYFSDSCSLRFDLKLMEQLKDKYECRPKQPLA